MFQKEIKDYYDAIQAKFPDVTMHDIKHILNYGWTQYVRNVQLGMDVNVHYNNRNVFHTGKLNANYDIQRVYYIKKMKIKIRLLWKIRQKQWDGYYYFSLTDDEWNAYQDKLERRKKPFPLTLGPKTYYKIYDECLACSFWSQYIFRVKSVVDFGFTYFRKEKQIYDMELYKVKDKGWRSLLTTRKNYEYQLHFKEKRLWRHDNKQAMAFQQG